jgi:hypothetical protein
MSIRSSNIFRGQQRQSAKGRTGQVRLAVSLVSLQARRKMASVSIPDEGAPKPTGLIMQIILRRDLLTVRYTFEWGI